MSRIFLTGADGFVGRRLVERFQGGELVSLQQTDRPPAAGASIVRADLRNPAAWRASLAGCDTVVHLASVTGKAPASLYFDTNLRGTEALLEAARSAGVRRFLFVSSIAVRFDDIRQYPYARSKLQAEAAVRAAGLPYVIVRPTMVFGPGSPVQAGFESLARLPVSPVFDGGRARVQPIHVEDLADLIADGVRDDAFTGATLEFGGPEVVTVSALIERMRSLAGRAAGRLLSVPTAPLRPLLALLERIDYRLAPITAGQLCTFRFDGAAEPNGYWEARRAGLRSLAAMLEGGAGR
jgi:NADH dehydrogenase